MRRADVSREIKFALQIVLAVVALAALALLAPVDWQRHFGKVRMGGGEKQ